MVNFIQLKMSTPKNFAFETRSFQDEYNVDLDDVTGCWYSTKPVKIPPGVLLLKKEVFNGTKVTRRFLPCTFETAMVLFDELQGTEHMVFHEWITGKVVCFFDLEVSGEHMKKYGSSDGFMKSFVEDYFILNLIKFFSKCPWNLEILREYACSEKKYSAHVKLMNVGFDTNEQLFEFVQFFLCHLYDDNKILYLKWIQFTDNIIDGLVVDVKRFDGIKLLYNSKYGENRPTIPFTIKDGCKPKYNESIMRRAFVSILQPNKKYLMVTVNNDNSKFKKLSEKCLPPKSKRNLRGDDDLEEPEKKRSYPPLESVDRAVVDDDMDNFLRLIRNYYLTYSDEDVDVTIENPRKSGNLLFADIYGGSCCVRPLVVADTKIDCNELHERAKYYTFIFNYSNNTYYHTCFHKKCKLYSQIYGWLQLPIQ